MRAQLYRLSGSGWGSFDVVNSSGQLFTLTPQGNDWAVKPCGTIGKGWKPANGATLLRFIPRNIKAKFLELQALK